ncbi:MAG: hypothetical protein JNM57_01810 [Cyclobacteriaceae bacterium]|nr:hypothetical protein [Cyclobacteriaceae bacterium]
MDKAQAKIKLKKVLRALKIFAVCSIILTLLEVGIGYWLLSSRWQLHISEPEMKEFAAELNSSETLPDNFLRIYQGIYPKHVNATMSELLFINYAFRFVLRDKDYDSRPHCFCDLVYDVQVLHNKKLDELDWPGRLVDLEYGFGLEKYTTPERCFTYFMNQQIEALKRKIKPDHYPAIAYKRIAQMNDEEILELIVLLKDPYKYDHYTHPELFEKQYLYFKQRLESTGLNLR